MNRHVYRRRRSRSFRMIAYDSTAASAAGMAGLCRPSAGISDRRVRTRRDGRGTQMDVASILVDGRPCGDSVATLTGRSRVWLLRWK